MSEPLPRADLYLSVDLEADGPVPGPYSMLSIGLCVAGRFDGDHFEAREPTKQTFYRELKPTGEQVDPAALKVARLDRDQLKRDGADPTAVMTDLAAWITDTAGDDRPVICAFPAAFDWSFLWWYMVVHGPADPPLSFSSCLDMKTMFAVKGARLFDAAGRGDLPNELRSARNHTHNALDDAIEQADVFARLFVWSRS